MRYVQECYIYVLLVLLFLLKNKKSTFSLTEVKFEQIILELITSTTTYPNYTIESRTGLIKLPLLIKKKPCVGTFQFITSHFFQLTFHFVQQRSIEICGI